jgi:hypothetical protein
MGAEDDAMDRTTKRSDVERAGLTDDTSPEEVVNDSLGRVDTADSTGLDTDLEKEHGIEREIPETGIPETKSDQADGTN